jgi:hypothetical protein
MTISASGDVRIAAFQRIIFSTAKIVYIGINFAPLCHLVSAPAISAGRSLTIHQLRDWLISATSRRSR